MIPCEELVVVVVVGVVVALVVALVVVVVLVVVDVVVDGDDEGISFSSGDPVRTKNNQ